MKDFNKDEISILYSIFTQNTPTRLTISNNVGLSLIKVSSVLNSLEKRHKIKKVGKTSTRTGRPSFVYSLDSKFGISFGISVGINNFRIVILDSQKELKYNKVYPLNIPSHPDNQADYIFKQVKKNLKKLIEEFSTKEKLVSIGLALPGMVDGKRGIWLRGLQLPGISNVPVKGLFEKSFNLPVYIDDISRSITYREVYKGEGLDISNFVLLYVGIGLGAGVVIDGKVFYGFHGLGGEIGHIQHVDNKYRCSCGSIGCLETVVSEPGILRVFRERLQEGVISYLNKYTFENIDALTLENILLAAHQKDQLTINTLGEIGEFIGDTCTILIKLYDPEKIIISGNSAIFKEYFEDPINRVINKRVLPEMLRDFKLVFSDYSPDQEAIGVALYAMKRALEDAKLKK